MDARTQGQPPESRSVAELADEARRLVAERYPQAVGALLGGSAAQGRATAGSDLDVAVLLPDGEAGGREVVRRDGRLAELFVHTVSDVSAAFERDRAQRRGTILFLYAQGLPLLDPGGHVSHVCERAREVLAAGPPPLAPEEWERGRYLLTCFLDDLADASPAARYEQLALADAVLREAAHLLTAHLGAWNGIGRWLPRRLLGADPVLGEALLAGHRAVAEQADSVRLLEAGAEVLGLCGGPLREGYVQHWGPSA
ncbi:nucleotidyltransferase domain-containing protein [Streptomyces cyaneofuscatus]|uniref:nucleotidyltransferase domain-containing protein n=1 Tax=Streptomyces TaxID=1883 RepID=UPI0004C4C095|nr:MULTISPECIES: nucleotidyltransferase domain-containing protein [Streptomyces]ONI54481.1 Nucleotidyltransferase domain protein [Streptomyces sp. IB2014 011-1]RDV53243.1 nucleotidyltransferase domain-containing protein [Streptomyces sp. IB2014 011-12]CAD5966578.1 Nucleotidyltransferase domain protein [Streptomyces sp. KY70]CAD5977095.1 Nucleotidyltransferase domain protein [Streptomyces sp. KY75]